jgi:hypothetical protein
MKRIILTITVVAVLVFITLNYLGTPRRMDTPAVSQWLPVTVGVAASASPIIPA